MTHPGRRSSEPEHISLILARVFRDLERLIDKSGGCPLDRKREAQTLPARVPSGGIIGRMDQVISSAYNERLAEKS